MSDSIDVSGDRALLEAAARAAGIELRWYAHTRCNGADMEPQRAHIGDVIWNPLIDDGDCFRLIIRLKMLGLWQPAAAMKPTNIEGFWDGDPYAATRRSVVRAAASIGAQS